MTIRKRREKRESFIKKIRHPEEVKDRNDRNTITKYGNRVEVVLALRKINIEKSALSSVVKCIVDMNTVMLDCLHTILCIFDGTAKKENVKENLIMCLRDVEIHM